jgi:hypothetical protein
VRELRRHGANLGCYPFGEGESRPLRGTITVTACVHSLPSWFPLGGSLPVFTPSANPLPPGRNGAVAVWRGGAVALSAVQYPRRTFFSRSLFVDRVRGISWVCVASGGGGHRQVASACNRCAWVRRVTRQCGGGKWRVASGYGPPSIPHEPTGSECPALYGGMTHADRGHHQVECSKYNNSFTKVSGSLKSQFQTLL